MPKKREIEDEKVFGAFAKLRGRHLPSEVEAREGDHDEPDGDDSHDRRRDPSKEKASSHRELRAPHNAN
jgi:hypothetical protein